jgi:hypothetical protein
MRDALTALEYLPTGGRSPLAHALDLAQILNPSHNSDSYNGWQNERLFDTWRAVAGSLGSGKLG